MRQNDIELRIEKLVFYGVAPGDRSRIGKAVMQELSRLFAEQGTLPSLAQGGEIASLDGGSFEVKPGSNAEAIGVQMARAVYEGLS
jgi:hypothetical protein